MNENDECSCRGDGVSREGAERGRGGLRRARGRRKVRRSRGGLRGMNVMTKQPEEGSIVRSENGTGIDGLVENEDRERSAIYGEMLSQSRERFDEILLLKTKGCGRGTERK